MRYAAFVAPRAGRRGDWARFRRHRRLGAAARPHPRRRSSRPMATCSSLKTRDGAMLNVKLDDESARVRAGEGDRSPTSRTTRFIGIAGMPQAGRQHRGLLGAHLSCRRNAASCPIATARGTPSPAAP